MKLPSLQYLLESTKASFLRFPLTILSALFAVSIGIWMAEFNDEIVNFYPYTNSLLAFALGVPSFFCASVYLSDKNKSNAIKVGIYTGIALLLFCIYLYLPDSKETLKYSTPYIRYGIYNIIAHLFVAFIPFISKKQVNGFWNYNKGLFIRFALSALYSACLYLGLTLALFALKELFGIDIKGIRYFQMFILIIGLFNTWFFVAGIPKDLNKLEDITDYPKGLRVFTQFVLLPLLILYLIILYGYGAKILIEQDWPKGIVSYLISGVSVFGIFTMLLIYPFRAEKDKGWIGKFSTWYYYLLFPLVIMLFIAVGMRVSDYGITVNRYVLIVLGIWLSLISLYFSIGKTNIKIIPILLAIFLALTSFGPWGMFSVSERSQVNRLEKILTENGILLDGKIQNEVIWDLEKFNIKENQIQNNHNKIPTSDKREVKSILRYLSNHHGLSDIQPWFSQNMDSIFQLYKSKYKYAGEIDFYQETIGLTASVAFSEEVVDFDNKYTYLTQKPNYIEVRGYDNLIQNRSLRILKSLESNTNEFILNEKIFAYGTKNKNEILFIAENADTAFFKLDKFVLELTENSEYLSQNKVYKDKMILKGKSERYKFKIHFKSVIIKGTPKVNYLNRLRFNLLIKEK